MSSRSQAHICFIDTNIWLYAFIPSQDQNKSAKAKAVIRQSDIIISSQVRGLVKVSGELTNRTDVALLGALGVSSELKRLDHSLAKFGHGYTSCFEIIGTGSIDPFGGRMIEIDQVMAAHICT